MYMYSLTVRDEGDMSWYIMEEYIYFQSITHESIYTFNNIGKQRALTNYVSLNVDFLVVKLSEVEHSLPYDTKSYWVCSRYIYTEDS